MTAADYALISVAGVQAFATAVLVGVTIWYAKSARTMAKEMQNQRYDTFRPVIDIENINAEEGPSLKRVNYREATDDEKTSSNPFTCVLCNYGTGAALDIYSFKYHINGKPAPYHIGNIQAKGSKEIRSGLNDIPYNVKYVIAKKIGSQWFLAAYYKDVYGHCFESVRSVTIKGEEFEIGTLQYRKLDRHKDDKLINEMWTPSTGEVTESD